MVSSCHVVDVPSLSNFVPNPMNRIHIYGRNSLCYPYSSGWFFCDKWSWIFFGRKWEIEIRETTNNAARAPHQCTIPLWLEGILSSSALVEWHLGAGGGREGLTENLRTMRYFCNVSDQIISPSSEVTTADFCITNLETPCVAVYRNGKYMKGHDHALHLQGVI